MVFLCNHQSFSGILGPQGPSSLETQGLLTSTSLVLEQDGIDRQNKARTKKFFINISMN